MHTSVAGQRLRLAALTLISLALLLVAGCSTVSPPQGPGSKPPSSTSPSRSTHFNSGGAALFGAWVQPLGGHTRSAQMHAVTDLEARLGRKLAIDQFYVPRFSAVATWQWRLIWDGQQGRVPMVSFGTEVNTQSVVAGTYDAQLRGYGTALRAFRHPVFMRYGGEMDGVRNRPWVRSGNDYVAAWRHVRAVIAAPNAQWVWSPNAPAFGGAHGGVNQYWPGASQVDWVGADGYNFYGCHPTQPWMSFNEIFAPFVTWGKRMNKPLMVSEFGTTEDPRQPDRKARWLSDIVRDLHHSMSPIKAIVYFDSDSAAMGCNWRLDSSQSTRQSLALLGHASALSAGISPP